MDVIIISYKYIPEINKPLAFLERNIAFLERNISKRKNRKIANHTRHQSRSPSMLVRRLRVGIALEKSNWFTLDFQREFYPCSAIVANINKVFRISRRKFDTLWNRLKITTNSGGNMYESFGLIGIQLPEKYKENFDVSCEGASICTFYSVCIHRTWPLLITIISSRMSIIYFYDLKFTFKFPVRIYGIRSVIGTAI
jgi:hypothetical protein